MTRIEIRRGALRAAAKVAFTMSIVGCGGASVEMAEAEGEEGSDALGACPTPDAGRWTPPRKVCGIAPGKPFTEKTLACCRPVIQTESTATAGRAESTCCEAFIAEVNGPNAWAEGGIDIGANWELVSRCCDVAGRPSGPACTPWGPPVPPEMPREEAA